MLFFFIFVVKEIAAAIKTVGADFLLRQSDSGNQRFYLVELHAAEAQALAYLLHHMLVFGAVGGGLFLQILLGITLKVL